MLSSSHFRMKGWQLAYKAPGSIRFLGLQTSFSWEIAAVSWHGCCLHRTHWRSKRILSLGCGAASFTSMELKSFKKKKKPRDLRSDEWSATRLGPLKDSALGVARNQTPVRLREHQMFSPQVAQLLKHASFLVQQRVTLTGG